MTAEDYKAIDTSLLDHAVTIADELNRDPMSPNRAVLLKAGACLLAARMSIKILEVSS